MPYYFQGWCLICAVVLVGCGKKSGDNTRPPLEQTAMQIVRPNNQFAIKLYAELHEQPGNLVISPYGGSVSMGLLLAGADGGTRDEILKALAVTSKQEQQFHNGQGALRRWLAGSDESVGDQLDVAAAVFIQSESDLLKSFWRMAETDYGGKPQIVDFGMQPATARKVINDWGAEKSRGKLGELVAPDDITSETRLILANAAYFKGAWQHSFPAADTKKAPFHVSGEQVVEVDMMHKTDRCGYWKDDKERLLVMPYRDRFSMIFLLSDDKDGLRLLEEQLDLDLVSTSIDKAVANVVEVPIWIPRFKFENVHDLKPALEAVGIASAFDPKAADLSRIDGERPGASRLVDRLYLSRARQRAIVEVNEEGTEAAAVTTTDATTDKGPKNPPQFRADHPFLFLIRENETGLILFMGRVVDPTQS
jgi:serine protease inhibitor